MAGKTRTRLRLDEKTMSDLDYLSRRLLEHAAEHWSDEQLVAAFSPEGLGRQAQWTCEDDWVVMYTTQRIKHGTLDGLFATTIFKPKGRGSKRIWERVKLYRCDTRREAKQWALRAYYEHSPKAAAKHGWNGEGYE